MAPQDRDILPDTVKPVHYNISLYDLEFTGGFHYQGSVKIELDIVKSTQSISLNALNLNVKTAEIVPRNDSSQRATKITHNAEAQTTTIEFSQEVAADQNVVLDLQFQAAMGATMNGFYRSKYKSADPTPDFVPREGDDYLMFSTQFEACDARRAIPCFDEPNLKATFDFEIEIPSGLVALSNMPEKGRRPGKDGKEVVSFERTPIMSTYLLAWAFGDFEYIEAFTEREYGGKKLPVRVYTTRGLKYQGQWGLEHTHKIVDYFSNIFQIDYPLPKVDLLAVHEFSQGAMENWGLITYRTTAILFDEARSAAAYRKRIVYVVAHELAHQWFGNLVTMEWWSELWLNESFATWVGFLATDHFHPEWEYWAQFVVEAAATAFSLDSLRSSHPIEVPVRSAVEVDQIFDAISYYKGSSVIRMLSSHLGRDVFLQGVSDYLKSHSYGNATTKDLWTALSLASGQDVNAFMNPWIRKIGFPVLTIAEEPGQISVLQSRFLSSGDVKPEEDETVWWIPLGFRTNARSDPEEGAGALSTKNGTIRNVDDTFYKLNSNATGFYRTNYPPARLTKLGASREKLSVEDRISLIQDAAALAISGEATSVSLLALCAEFKEETNYLVWAQLLSSLSNVRSLFDTNEEITASLDTFILDIITPALTSVGWEYPPGEDFLRGQLRSLLITHAGQANHREYVRRDFESFISNKDTRTINEALKRFSAYQSGNEAAIHANLRLAVFRTAVSNGGQAAYEEIKRQYLANTSAEFRELCLTSMGRVEDPNLVNDFMDFTFSDSVPAQDTHTGPKWLAENPKARIPMWTWVKSNWDKVEKKLAGNTVTIDRFVRMGLNKFSSSDVLEDLERFFQDKDTTPFKRSLVVVKDTIRANAVYRNRDEKLILEWKRAGGKV